MDCSVHDLCDVLEEPGLFSSRCTQLATVLLSVTLWLYTVQERSMHTHTPTPCGLGRSVLASSSCVCVEESLFHSSLIILYYSVRPLYFSLSVGLLGQSIHSSLVQSMHDKRAQYKYREHYN